MPHYSNTQSGRTAKQVFGDVQEIAHQSRVNDWYDTTTLAGNQLDQAASLFYAIAMLLENTPEANPRIKDLARTGMTITDNAAMNFEDQAARLDQVLNIKGAA